MINTNHPRFELLTTMTLVVAELDDPSAESERKLYRTLNHFMNSFGAPSVSRLPLVMPTIGMWEGVLARSFAIRADLFVVPAMSELFEKQDTCLVYAAESTPIGYLTDGNDLDAAPRAFTKSATWSAAMPEQDCWTYFPEKGLYLTCEMW